MTFALDATPGDHTVIDCPECGAYTRMERYIHDGEIVIEGVCPGCATHLLICDSDFLW